MPLPAVLAALAAGLAWVGAKLGMVARGGSDAVAVHAAAGGGSTVAAGGSAAAEGAEGVAALAVGGGAALAVIADSMNDAPSVKDKEDKEDAEDA
jgi:hypothetical protein